jgi:transcriptional regulator with XRE-family HTH domain
MAKRQFTIFKTYHFRGQDPIVDKIKTVVSDDAAGRGIAPKLAWAKAAEKSGVSKSTTSNWRSGKTYRPQFATLNAIARACGHELDIVPIGRKK